MLPSVYNPALPPFDHQREAIQRGYEQSGFAYFLEMGLGKSRVLIDDFCLNFALGKVEGLLIIAPKSVYTNWSRQDKEFPGELQKWMWPSLPTYECYTYRAGRMRPDALVRSRLMEVERHTPRILVVNAESLPGSQDAADLCARFLRAHRSMIVVDESTLIKNPNSERTKISIRLSRLAEYRRILSGSPSTGSQSDFWAQFEFLGPGEKLLGYDKFHVFRERYCHMVEMMVQGRRIRTEKGPNNTAELADRVARHSFRKKKNECLDLPPKEYDRRVVVMSDEQKRVYNELKRTAMARINDAGDEVTTQIVITQLMRMHQVVCGHVKIDDGRIVRLKSGRMLAVEELLQETDEQAVIWTAYRPDADMVVARLRELYGEDCVAQWHGGRNMAQREEDEKEFQSGRKRFMVATSAGARGRTWTAATLVIYYSNSHDLEIREQSEDRTHRIGTTGIVSYYDIVCEGTVDEKIIAALRMKKDVARAVLRDGIEAWI